MITLDMIQERLIEAITLSGLKKIELAKQIGVSHQAVSQYVNRESMPALDTFAKLCAVLDLDANEILCVNEFKE